MAGVPGVSGTNAAGIAALRGALGAPVLDFAVRYEDGPRVRLPHFETAHYIVEFLDRDALLQLHDGRPGLALADTIAGVRLAARWNREPILTTQLMRIAIAMIMSATTWQVLQFQGWDDTDLAALQEAWLELDLPASGDATLDLEAAEKLDMLQHLSREDYDRFSASLSGSEGEGPDSFIGVLKLCCRDPKEGAKAAWDRYPCWWAFRIWGHYQVEKMVLQQIEEFRTLLRAAVEKGAWLVPLREAETNVTRLEGRLPWVPYFNKYSGILTYPKLMAKYAGIEAQRSLVLAAIALERHRHKHGRYPAGLEQLVPEFLAALPRDPMNGQTLRYRRKDDGSYTLYSVGRNGEDDGGDPTPLGTLSYGENGKDIVWPKAASQAGAVHLLESQLSDRLANAISLSLNERNPNEVVKGNIAHSGIAVAAFKTDNLLQLFNPFAPPKYGSGEDNVLRDLETDRISGWKLFSIGF